MVLESVPTLVERAQRGDRAAYGELIKRFQDAVWAIALKRLHDATAAQELTQEVFIHAMKKLPQLRNPRCFPGWLRQITVRLALNRLAERKRKQMFDTGNLDDLAGRTPDPHEALARKEAKRLLHTGLSLLRPLDRQALEGYYLRGHSLRRMSRDSGTPVGTLKRRLHTARRRLREVLETGPSPGDVELSQAC